MLLLENLLDCMMANRMDDVILMDCNLAVL